jgi:hypothetical protein
LELISDFVFSQEIIDHASFIEVAVALVSARLPTSVKTWRLIEDINSAFDTKDVWSFYSKLWILSKYGDNDDVMRAIEEDLSIWITEDQASRLVAGMYSRFVGTAYLTKFEQIMYRTANQASRGVLDFLDALTNTPAGFRSVLRFIKATNPSLPNKISHAKFLMVRAALHNEAVGAAATATLKASHTVALQDEYYCGLVPA